MLKIFWFFRESAFEPKEDLPSPAHPFLKLAYVPMCDDDISPALLHTGPKFTALFHLRLFDARGQLRLIALLTPPSSHCSLILFSIGCMKSKRIFAWDLFPAGLSMSSGLQLVPRFFQYGKFRKKHYGTEQTFVMADSIWYLRIFVLKGEFLDFFI